ncbi:metalloregulator ArsR/SmtB family transcription factor [Peptoniphilus sp. KCTC 25270]|uniref:ArsR/SmtB family transcription factor n=1 Tax=Peptoniphilus sp. KCTC 25270 TaxID=2897414 RepID=UPI001E2D7221|nr:metalloregulator ArsR/SmtB family transcription factor [Peptoniphilus sp. KCTC 25270]MCD1146754.1 metalloregulator ArsR/SmtB family transcription factor [Peptoniphilus sp. KCTC 25270]
MKDEKSKRVEKSIESFVNDLEQLEILASLFKAMADSTRLKIIYALSVSTLNVSELSQMLGMSQSSISHQLQLLRENQLIKFERVGRNNYYSLDDEHVLKLFDSGLEHTQHKLKGID